MAGSATDKEAGGYGLPHEILLDILGKWWFRRDEVGLPGDEWYISEKNGRAEFLDIFYTAPKVEGKIHPLTPEEHAAGFVAYRKSMLNK